LLVSIIPKCLRGALRKEGGGGGQHPVLRRGRHLFCEECFAVYSLVSNWYKISLPRMSSPKYKMCRLMKESVLDLYGCSKKKESKIVKAEMLRNDKKATRKNCFKKERKGKKNQ
jgi:hypothetical protein